MNTKFIAFTAASAVAMAAFAGAASAREIKIVGSSTVFPYTQAVAEEFAKKGGTAPTVESTGTGGGMKIFCQGIGEGHPDLTGASRAMKKSEWELCEKNGVTDVTELLLGYDGLSVANSRKGKKIDVTKEQLYKALAAKVPVDGKLVANTYKKWSEIDSSLPEIAIIAYGPPPTSGTRDAFVELVFHEVCEKSKEGYWADTKKSASKEDFGKMLKEDCTAMRTDGPFIEAGENDNLIVQRLEADANAVGIFGYSFLFENQDKLQALTIGGVEPSMETIASGDYGISRPLFIYIKNPHRKVIKGMDDFVKEYVSDEAMSKDGYLSERGLVALDEAKLKEVQEAALNAKGMNVPTN
ncbi:substrate-binding domain-containing protein [Hyphomicrobium sp. CS1GBMeth3]|uniref:substrate-binding domain-containing protein n=1 Tax=Hyphomicrobium sp. CS1GBMeth3 TaxID=1892845 RepID=UPI001FCD40A7|nr:substrate-binding domain-containing protein [Hyphomicrobium sp. CS1GBMeth3]